jgi:hypothetical protein
MLQRIARSLVVTAGTMLQGIARGHGWNNAAGHRSIVAKIIS